MIRNVKAYIQAAATMSRVLGNWCRRFDDRFYGWLALAIASLFVLDLTVTRLIPGLEGSGYDSLIKYRLDGPNPDKRIVIVDIDERALAELGKSYGRWPWPREVIAESIAAVAESQPRAIYTNILFSEPDIGNPAGDEALQIAAESYPNLVFPFVRLPEINDRASQISARQIPHAVLRSPVTSKGDTVALIPPAFVSLERNMGYANLHPDDDGIIRRYRYWLSTETALIPSAASSALRVFGAPVTPSEDNGLLNWRNKNGAYQRVSMADLYAMSTGAKPFNAAMFKDKIVIIGISAPGIAVVKPTSSSLGMDDNEILATAIDDGLNGTALQESPIILNIFASFFILILLSWSFVRRVDQGRLDLIFGAGQVGLIAITLLSVSYTKYIVDLTVPFNVGLAYFVIARGYYAINEASWRGMDSFWNRLRVDHAELLMLIIAQRDEPHSMRALDQAKQSARRITQVENLLLLSEIIEDRSFLGKPVSELALFMIFLDSNEEADQIKSEIGDDKQNLIIRTLDVHNLDLEKVRIEIWRTILSYKLIDKPIN